MTVHERPGVYSEYDLTASLWRRDGGKTVGLAALAAEGESNRCVVLTGYEEGIAHFGEDGEATHMAALLRLLFQNGAARVVAVRVADGEHYGEAFVALEAEESVQIVVCDSSDAAVHQLMRQSVETASEQRRERIGIVGGSGSAAELAEQAAALNCERMVVTGGTVLGETGEALPAAFAAAALAGAISCAGDPAVPLNGQSLAGFSGTAEHFDDNQIDLLVRGGVTPLETVGGEVCVVRGITSRSTSEGVADAAWRELTTVLIVDDVITAVRNAVRTRFMRKKNTAQTRGAIRAQVIMELESKKEAEIIDSYGDVSVTAGDEDPTVCLVEFAFGVAHGLNRIYLTAHITV